MKRTRIVLGAMTLAATGCLRPALSTTASSSPAGNANAASSSELSSVRSVEYLWKNVQILGGGFVTGIIYSSVKADLVYARTDIGGAYRYGPEDKAWIPLTDGLSPDDANYMGIESLALDPVDANKVYMAVGTYTKDWAGKGAFMRSSDQGKTWQIVPMSFKMGGNEWGRSNGERLAVDPNQPKILFFGSRKDGLWKSSDGAETWNRVESFPKATDPYDAGITFLSFHAKTGKPGSPTPVLYAGAADPKASLLVSLDAGASWQPIAAQPTGLLPSHGELDPNGILLVTYGNHPGPNDITTGAVHKYDPKRQLWTDITPLVPSAEDKFGYGGLAVDRSHPGTVMVTTIDRWTKKDEIFRSTDGGQHWTPLARKTRWDAAGAKYLYWGRAELGIPHWMGDIDIDPFHPERAMFVTGAGIWASENVTAIDSGGTVDFRFHNRGLEETSVGVLVSPPAGPPLLSGVGDVCGFRHDDLGVAPPQGFYANPPCNGTTGLDFAETEPSLVARVGRTWGSEKHGAYSTDGGAHWTPFASEPEGAATGGMVAMTSDGKSMVWTVKGKVATYSRDRGATWTRCSGLPSSANIPDWANFDLQPVSDRVNPNQIYLLEAMQGRLYVSVDGGASFKPGAEGMPSKADWALGSSSIRAVPGFEGHLWITTGQALYRSTDSGANLEIVSSVEESVGIAFGKPKEGAKYPAVYLIGKVGKKKGFYRTDDIGETWVRMNDDQHQYGWVTIIQGDPRVYGRVYLGTSGRGIVYGEPGGR